MDYDIKVFSNVPHQEIEQAFSRAKHDGWVFKEFLPCASVDGRDYITMIFIRKIGLKPVIDITEIQDGPEEQGELEHTVVQQDSDL